MNDDIKYIICPNCKNPIDSDSEVCPLCRVELFECDMCGTIVLGEAKFCYNCGANFDEVKNNEKKRDINIAPWSRYWGRMIDLFYGSTTIFIIMFLLFPQYYNKIISDKYSVIFIVTILYVFLESAFLVIWGSTPGKYLLNISLVLNNGEKFTFKNALERTFKVWYRGLGFGIPIIYFFTLINAFSKLKNNHITSWDKELNITVTHSKVGIIRILIATFLILGYLSFITYLGSIK